MTQNELNISFYCIFYPDKKFGNATTLILIPIKSRAELYRFILNILIKADDLLLFLFIVYTELHAVHDVRLSCHKYFAMRGNCCKPYFREPNYC